MTSRLNGALEKARAWKAEANDAVMEAMTEVDSAKKQQDAPEWSWLFEEDNEDRIARPKERSIDTEAEEDEEFEDVTESLKTLMSDPEMTKDMEPLSPWLTWRGRYTLLIANNKQGKSWIAASDAVLAAKQGLRVLWFSIDESAHGVIWRFSKFDNIEDVSDSIRAIPSQKSVKSFEHMKAIIKEHKADVVYVDSFHSYVSKFVPNIPASHESGKWRTIADHFGEMARDNNCGICVIMHAKKDGSDFSGNEQIGASADMKIHVKLSGKNKRRLEYEGRWGHEDTNLQFLGEEKGKAGCVAISEAKVSAEAWILTALKDGRAYKREELISAGRSEGFAEKAIETARRNLIKSGRLEESYPPAEGRRGKATYTLSTDGNKKASQFHSEISLEEAGN